MTSTKTDTVILMELTVPWEDRMELSNVLKEDKYSELMMDLIDKGYRVHIFAIEVGARGLVGRSSYTFLREIGLPSRGRSKIMKTISTSSWNGVPLAVDKKWQPIACLHRAANEPRASSQVGASPESKTIGFLSSRCRLGLYKQGNRKPTLGSKKSVLGERGKEKGGCVVGQVHGGGS